jgi:hypothetical protein
MMVRQPSSLPQASIVTRHAIRTHHRSDDGRFAQEHQRILHVRRVVDEIDHPQRTAAYRADERKYFIDARQHAVMAMPMPPGRRDMVEVSMEVE